MLRPAAVLLAVVLLAACSPRPSTQPEMWRHFTQAGEVQSAVIAGDLDRAKAGTAHVAESDPLKGLASSLRPYDVALRDAARRGGQARTLAEVATVTGEIGKSCGDCHRAAGASLAFNYVAAPAKSDQPVMGAMLRHRWGADMMWNGLVGPSDSAWVAGANALAEESTYSELFNPRSAKGDSMRVLAAQVRRLGHDAAATKDPARQATLYGELLGTCTTCHKIAR